MIAVNCHEGKTIKTGRSSRRNRSKLSTAQLAYQALAKDGRRIVAQLANSVSISYDLQAILIATNAGLQEQNTIANAPSFGRQQEAW